MKKLLLTSVLLWAVWCFAAPSVKINAGSLRCINDAYIYVNGGSITNANTGTPFSATNTKICTASTTFYGPEGNLDALVITPSGNMGSTTVAVTSGSFHPQTTTSVVQWWNINPSTSQTCQLEFRFRNSYLNSLTLGNLAVWEYSGSWVKLSENITASNVGSSFTSVTFSGVNFASSKAAHQIILGDKNDQTLPVELSSFTANATVDGIVSLSWVTQSESGMLGYYVWRSGDEYLANALSVSPLIQATNTSTTQIYLFNEESSLSSGDWYYWLQARDMDGTERYYGSIVVTVGENQPEVPPIPLVSGLKSLYPNPFNPDLNIAYGLKEAVICEISIINLRGQVIRWLLSSSQNAGNYTLHWDGKDSYGVPCSSGIYFVRMQAGKESFIKRVALLK